MIRRSTLRPTLGLVVLLLAFAVVAMHQLGAGHHSMPSGHGVSMASDAATPQAQDEEPGHTAAMMTGSDCSFDCAHSTTHDLGSGVAGAHGVAMVCLAVLPLLLVVAGVRRALRTRWRQRLAGTAATAGLRPPPPTGRGSSAPSLLRLCVSRT